ncbi:MAG: flagellar basal body P-ring formation chaperone FlgA [Pseudomonadota bacterium]
MRYAVLIAALLLGPSALASDYVALRNLAAQTSLKASDARALSGSALPLEGRETARFLRKGEEFDQTALQPRAVLERNQLVQLRFRKGSLDITTEGRVLERAALGARVQVMNLASRTIVTGQVVSASIVAVD